MNCPNCGKPMQDGAVLCPACSAQQTTAALPDTAPSTGAPVGTTQPPAPSSAANTFAAPQAPAYPYAPQPPVYAPPPSPYSAPRPVYYPQPAPYSYAPPPQPVQQPHPYPYVPRPVYTPPAQPMPYSYPQQRPVYPPPASYPYAPPVRQPYSYPQNPRPAYPPQAYYAPPAPQPLPYSIPGAPVCVRPGGTPEAEILRERAEYRYAEGAHFSGSAVLTNYRFVFFKFSEQPPQAYEPGNEPSSEFLFDLPLGQIADLEEENAENPYVLFLMKDGRRIPLSFAQNTAWLNAIRTAMVPFGAPPPVSSPAAETSGEDATGQTLASLAQDSPAAELPSQTPAANAVMEAEATLPESPPVPVEEGAEQQKQDSGEAL